MKSKLFTLFILSFVLLSLAACGSSSKDAVQSSTLEKVIKDEKLTVGVILSFPPFGFKDEDGEPQGYDVDLAKLVADSLNAELEIKEVTSAARIPSLETGKVDVVIGNFTMNLERAQKVSFTDPYVVAGQTILVKEDSPVEELEDMNNEKYNVAVTKGSTNSDIVKNLAPKAEINYFETSDAAVTAVKNGQSDAFIEDSNFEQYMVKKNPDLKVVGDSVVPQEYNSFGVKQGDQVWLNYLNEVVFQINTNGENAELYEKWFGVEPPFKINPDY